MPELTLESLAARLSEVERQLQELRPAATKKDWRSVVGMFDDDPGFLEVIAEGRALRESDRGAAPDEADDS